jgi:predicted PurR-regulated permease PerM
MINISLFSIIIILFILFVVFQIVFYLNIYKKNQNLIKKIESFQSTLTNIKNNNNEYILDDNSMEIILEDYNKLKDNI